MSSLLSGAPVSLAPSAITAIVPSFETHGTKQWTPRSRHDATSSTREAAHGERIVEAHRLPLAEPVADARRGVDRRQRLGEADRLRRHVAPRRPVADRREQQRHALETERLHDPSDQPLAEPLQLEIAVQVARKADERAPIVVAIAVVGAIERHLDGVLHQRREQHDDQRGEHRDDRVALAGAAEEELARELEQHGVDRRNRRDHRGVDHRALDDHLDVHQPVADDGGGEGEREEPQRNGEEPELRSRIEAGHPGQRVAEHERHAAEHGAADNPAQLAARGHRAHAPERAQHHREAAEHAGREIRQLEAIDGLEQPR